MTKGEAIMINKTAAGFVALFAVVLAVSVFVVGCSEEGAVAPSDRTTPEFARVSDTGGAQALGHGGGKAGGGTGGGGSSAVAMSQIEIDPDAGGSLTVGRFTVTVPAGAIDQAMTLEISDESAATGFVIGQLGPHGQTFDEPVILEISLAGTTAENWDDVAVFWFDEAAGQWEKIGGVYDPDAKTISVELEHFSQYGTGRAGW